MLAGRSLRDFKWPMRHWTASQGQWRTWMLEMFPGLANKQKEQRWLEKLGKRSLSRFDPCPIFPVPFSPGPQYISYAPVMEILRNPSTRGVIPSLPTLHALLPLPRHLCTSIWSLDPLLSSNLWLYWWLVIPLHSQLSCDMNNDNNKWWYFLVFTLSSYKVDGSYHPYSIYEEIEAHSGGKICSMSPSWSIAHLCHPQKRKDPVRIISMAFEGEHSEDITFREG